MSKSQTLRGLINQRLSLAAEEIFELFERTIAEYEEQLCRSKEENERQQKLLEAVYNPQLRLNRSDVQQQNEDQEQQPSPSLDQEDPPKLPHIKEEEEKQGSSQEGEQALGVEEEDFKVFTFTPSVKIEEDGEKPQTSQFYEIQTEETREEVSQSSESDTDDSCLDRDIMDSESGLNPNHNSEESDNNVKNINMTSAHSSEHPTRFNQKEQLLENESNKKSAKGHSCSFCNKTFPCKAAVEGHMLVHTGERPFLCSICGARFNQKNTLTLHLRVHTGEKPFTCTYCNKSFSLRHNLNVHMRVHTGDRPYSCSVCGNKYKQHGNLTRHMSVHMDENPFSCSVCGKRFAQSVTLKRHMFVHMQ